MCVYLLTELDNSRSVGYVLVVRWRGDCTELGRHEDCFA